MKCEYRYRVVAKKRALAYYKKHGHEIKIIKRKPVPIFQNKNGHMWSHDVHVKAEISCSSGYMTDYLVELLLSPPLFAPAVDVGKKKRRKKR